MAKIDLETLSRTELIQLRAEVDSAIQTAQDRDRQKALKAAEALAQEHGFSLAELVPGAAKGRDGRSRRGSAAPSAKYRNPENPEQSWSGKGRRPGWVKDALENGRSLADLAA